MEHIFNRILEIGIYSGFVIAAVLIIRLLFRKTSKTLLCGLWLLVGLRLAFFVPVESSLSILPSISLENMVAESIYSQEEKSLSSELEERIGNESEKYTNASIDIFPLDGTPNNLILRKIYFFMSSFQHIKM